MYEIGELLSMAFLSNEDDQPHLIFLLISAYGYLQIVNSFSQEDLNYRLTTPLLYQDPFRILASSVKGKVFLIIIYNYYFY